MSRRPKPLTAPADIRRLPYSIVPYWQYELPTINPALMVRNETIWIGPVSAEDLMRIWSLPPSSDPEAIQKRCFESAGEYIRNFAPDLHFATGCDGDYAYVRRLESGPVRKLSDWKQLEVGTALILSLEPTDKAVEFAVTRAGYLRHKGIAGFEPFLDADGTLWVARVAQK